MSATVAPPPGVSRRSSPRMRYAKTARTLSDVLKALGGIDADRVRSHKFGRATVADAIKINERKEGLVELVEGVLVEKARGFPEAVLAASLVHKIVEFARTHNLGIVGGAGAMTQLFPDLLRGASVSFFSWERVKGKVPTEAAPVIAPDLAIEVLSPGNTAKEMDRKCGEYFKSGAKAVWLVCRKTKTVAVYSSPDQYLALTENDVISGGMVLPGFTLEVRRLFGELERTQG
jgi:Uma2 family endonuclease